VLRDAGLEVNKVLGDFEIHHERASESAVQSIGWISDTSGNGLTSRRYAIHANGGRRGFELDSGYSNSWKMMAKSAQPSLSLGL
jgi:hypothetical protein